MVRHSCILPPLGTHRHFTALTLQIAASSTQLGPALSDSNLPKALKGMVIVTWRGPEGAPFKNQIREQLWYLRYALPYHRCQVLEAGVHVVSAAPPLFTVHKWLLLTYWGKVARKSNFSCFQPHSAPTWSWADNSAEGIWGIKLCPLPHPRHKLPKNVPRGIMPDSSYVLLLFTPVWAPQMESEGEKPQPLPCPQDHTSVWQVRYHSWIDTCTLAAKRNTTASTAMTYTFPCLSTPVTCLTTDCDQDWVYEYHRGHACFLPLPMKWQGCYLFLIR